jgi:hypothetical protein
LVGNGSWDDPRLERAVEVDRHRVGRHGASLTLHRHVQEPMTPSANRAARAWGFPQRPAGAITQGHGREPPRLSSAATRADVDSSHQPSPVRPRAPDARTASAHPRRSCRTRPSRRRAARGRPGPRDTGLGCSCPVCPAESHAPRQPACDCPHPMRILRPPAPGVALDIHPGSSSAERLLLTSRIARTATALLDVFAAEARRCGGSERDRGVKSA